MNDCIETWEELEHVQEEGKRELQRQGLRSDVQGLHEADAKTH